MNNYHKTEKYDPTFLSQNMMGPNSMLILESLTQDLPLKPGMRVLDLGCGSGLTSLFLAKEFGVEVFAVDLWVSATDNFERFKQQGMDHLIVPLHADALNLPFANDYFDAVISVDAYHYFGNNNHYFAEKLSPLLKKDALIGFAFPGLKYEVHSNIPAEMKPFWDDVSLTMWHSLDWWTNILAGTMAEFKIWEMDCFKKAWHDWLTTKNPYAIEDQEMITADNGRYMNLIALTGKNQ